MESDINLLNGESPYHSPNPSKTHLNGDIMTVQVYFVFTDLPARELDKYFTFIPIIFNVHDRRTSYLWDRRTG